MLLACPLGAGRVGNAVVKTQAVCQHAAQRGFAGTRSPGENNKWRGFFHLLDILHLLAYLFNFGFSHDHRLRNDGIRRFGAYGVPFAVKLLD